MRKSRCCSTLVPVLGPFGVPTKNRNSTEPHWALLVRLGTAWQPMFLMYVEPFLGVRDHQVHVVIGGGRCGGCPVCQIADSQESANPRTRRMIRCPYSASGDALESGPAHHGHRFIKEFDMVRTWGCIGLVVADLLVVAGWGVNAQRSDAAGSGGRGA